MHSANANNKFLFHQMRMQFDLLFHRQEWNERSNELNAQTVKGEH